MSVHPFTKHPTSSFVQIGSSYLPQTARDELRLGATFSARALLPALIALLVLDLAFISLHVIHLHADWLPSTRWSIERDRGYAEIFQYLKYTGVCLALIQLFRRTQMAIIPGWIALFVLLLLDDAGRLHEQFGLAVVAWAHIPDMGALRGRDVGELIYAALMFVLVAPILAVGYRRGSLRARALSCDLAVLVAALAACGVGGDLLHRMVSGTAINSLTGVIEDGGEMLVLSVTCFYMMQWVYAGVAFGRAAPTVRPGARLFRWADRRSRSDAHGGRPERGREVSKSADSGPTFSTGRFASSERCVSVSRSLACEKRAKISLADTSAGRAPIARSEKFRTTSTSPSPPPPGRR